MALNQFKSNGKHPLLPPQHSTLTVSILRMIRITNPLLINLQMINLTLSSLMNSLVLTSNNLINLIRKNKNFKTPLMIMLIKIFEYNMNTVIEIVLTLIKGHSILDACLLF